MQGTASALSAGLLGIDGYVVKVTATVELGAPSLTISGRSSHSLDEARERVAIGPTGELVELVEGQALVMSAELRSIDGRAFRIFARGSQGWVLEECP